MRGRSAGLRWHGRWLGCIGRIMYVTCWSGCRTGRWSGCRTGQDVLKNCAMSTDEVRGHTGIVTPKPVPERCLRVRSSLHEGPPRPSGVGCLEEDPRVMSMVERDMGLAALCSREHRGSVLRIAKARPRGFLAQRRSCRAWGFLCFALESATHRARCLTSLSLKVSPGPPRLL